jgi:hypothetical protein
VPGYDNTIDYIKKQHKNIIQHHLNIIVHIYKISRPKTVFTGKYKPATQYVTEIGDNRLLILALCNIIGFCFVHAGNALNFCGSLKTKLLKSGLFDSTTLQE